ncbi:hypothetical protein Nepgr_031313 [Nepenthes gracilis]|uniref:Uncharacterized protein n=1 Tax=Nepenthes gracilis TaxID=150966 RepID=A0AAD3TH52_NEPGR|nr:hypothetical protein Nepgr_031313 [Nepenthes gracilis]
MADLGFWVAGWGWCITGPGMRRECMVTLELEQAGLKSAMFAGLFDHFIDLAALLSCRVDFIVGLKFYIDDGHALLCLPMSR